MSARSSVTSLESASCLRWTSVTWVWVSATRSGRLKKEPQPVPATAMRRTSRAWAPPALELPFRAMRRRAEIPERLPRAMKRPLTMMRRTLVYCHGPRRAGAELPRARTLALLLDDELVAPVLRVRILGPGGIEGPLFSEAHRRQAIGGDAVVDEIVLGRRGALLAEGQVVLDGSPLVAVPLDRHAGPSLPLEPARILREHGARVFTQLVAIEIEVDPIENERRLDGRRSRSLRRRRRRRRLDRRGSRRRCRLRRLLLATTTGKNQTQCDDRNDHEHGRSHDHA